MREWESEEYKYNCGLKALMILKDVKLEEGSLHNHCLLEDIYDGIVGIEFLLKEYENKLKEIEKIK